MPEKVKVQPCMLQQFYPIVLSAVTSVHISLAGAVIGNIMVAPRFKTTYHGINIMCYFPFLLIDIVFGKGDGGQSIYGDVFEGKIFVQYHYYLLESNFICVCRNI